MTDAPAVSPHWSPRQRLAAGIVITYLLLQIAVPAILLFRHRPQRFSWQMFTTAPIIPSLVLHRTTGRRDTVDVNSYFAVRRPELSRSDLELLPSHVCRVTPDAGLIEFRMWRDSAPRLLACP